jgi:ATP-dependent DNA helicase RecQ
VLRAPDAADEVVERLAERFAQRERAETERIGRVLALVEHDRCQVAALVGYFGEERAEPCGHCTSCLEGGPRRLPDPDPAPPIGELVTPRALRAVEIGHPEALATPRQRARFLCGISSPATSRAKLTRDPLFGVLAERRFADVLAWCER